MLKVLAGNPLITREEQEAPSEDLRPIRKTEWKKIRQELKKSLETFEADAIREVADKYEHASYEGVSVIERLRLVLNYADEFAFDEALRALSEIGD